MDILNSELFEKNRKKHIISRINILKHKVDLHHLNLDYSNVEFKTIKEIVELTEEHFNYKKIYDNFERIALYDYLLNLLQDINQDQEIVNYALTKCELCIDIAKDYISEASNKKRLLRTGIIIVKAIEYLMLNSDSEMLEDLNMAIEIIINNIHEERNLISCLNNLTILYEISEYYGDEKNVEFSISSLKNTLRDFKKYEINEFYLLSALRYQYEFFIKTEYKDLRYLIDKARYEFFSSLKDKNKVELFEIFRIYLDHAYIESERNNKKEAMESYVKSAKIILENKDDSLEDKRIVNHIYDILIQSLSIYFSLENNDTYNETLLKLLEETKENYMSLDEKRYLDITRIYRNLALDAENKHQEMEFKYLNSEIEIREHNMDKKHFENVIYNAMAIKQLSDLNMSKGNEEEAIIGYLYALKYYEVAYLVKYKFEQEHIEEMKYILNLLKDLYDTLDQEQQEEFKVYKDEFKEFFNENH